MAGHADSRFPSLTQWCLVDRQLVPKVIWTLSQVACTAIPACMQPAAVAGMAVQGWCRSPPMTPCYPSCCCSKVSTCPDPPHSPSINLSHPTPTHVPPQQQQRQQLPRVFCITHLQLPTPQPTHSQQAQPWTHWLQPCSSWQLGQPFLAMKMGFLLGIILMLGRQRQQEVSPSAIPISAILARSLTEELQLRWEVHKPATRD